MTTLAACAVALAANNAQATPTAVNVRIEGRTQTLFEGPVLTEGHSVSSYKGAGGEEAEDIAEHTCDGISSLDPGNTQPGPTATAAGIDAMNDIGETQAMAGQWYPGFNDYFVKQWGSEVENGEADGRAWGILINNVFSDVGGCQFELSTGDEVLWVYNAFESRPFLALFPAGVGYTGGERPLTATAQLGKPFELEALSYEDDAEDHPPAEPESTGAIPISGVSVAPVLTSAKGFEKVELESPQAVTTNAEGKVSITFTTPGWRRLKAGAPVEAETDEEEAIRSNRLDVCVPAEGNNGCGQPPVEDRLRVPPRYRAGIGAEPENWAAPRISGRAISGHTLTAGEGLWTGDEPLGYTYRWQRCDKTGSGCEIISGATTFAYEIATSDETHTFRVAVTAHNWSGAVEKRSLPTSEVPTPPSSTEPPTIAGPDVEGQTLTSSSGLWAGAEPISLQYAWLRCEDTGGGCVNVSGPSTRSSYTLAAADVGHTLRAEVTATNPGGTTTAESPATPVVRPAPRIGPSAPVTAPTTQTLPSTSSRPAAKATIASLATRKLVVNVTVAGKVTVQISRRIRHAGKLSWRAFKSLTVRVTHAGAITVKLPKLSPGSYRFGITLAGSKAVFRVLTIHRR